MPESISVDDVFYYAIDDADFDSIQYAGLWVHNTTGFGEDTYKNTGSYGAPGATASFKFSGFGVATYIALPADLEGNQKAASLPLPNVTVVLDDQPPADVSVALNASQAFWYAMNLSQDATHSVTVKIVNQTDGFPFVLDEVLYLRTMEPSATATFTPPGSQQTISPGPSTFIPAFAPPNQSAAPDAAGSGLPVAAIVGGVVGGVTLLLGAALAFYFMCIRAKQLKLPESMVLDPYDYGGEIEEDKRSLLHHQHSGSTTVTGEDSLYKLPQRTSSPSADDASHPHPPSRPASIHTISAGRPPSLAGSDLPTTPPNSGPVRKAVEAGILSVPRPKTYHADSGIRFVANDTEAGPSTASPAHDSPIVETPTDVPPEYTPS
ncbi:hypothetical protein PYCCODRAFT_1422759 [Trametes coccinea BRFM310]|uniref:Uncharacterized protein n=1 Tax=Trametes coccinea (strain BRFM310) TaxID=1353009 RepID=A0A1Y2J2W5_TRAC3|nr:hypothetical protein PYCCODRAFT_1422759 [Trametes coccinea BRFM310]